MNFIQGTNINGLCQQKKCRMKNVVKVVVVVLVVIVMCDLFPSLEVLGVGDLATDYFFP